MALRPFIFTGFNYKFDALSTGPEKNELNKAFETAFQSGTSMRTIPIIRGMVPALRFLVGSFS